MIRKEAVVAGAVPVAVLVLALSLFQSRPDTSFVKESESPFHEAGGAAKSSGASSGARGIRGVSPDSAPAFHEAGGSGAEGSSHGGFKYKATQVIVRQGGDPARTLPIGTSCVGRLITAIDTRQSSELVRVLLPYGASFEHDRRIEKNSVLFGTVSYPGNGEKAFIQFNRLLSPEGQEFHVQAEALSSADYSPGLIGDEHDGAGGRIVSTTGLTMLSGITDALTQKQQLGELGASTPTATLPNAFMNGITQATQTEAQREGDQLQNAQEYVTVPAGKDLIVSLTTTYRGESE